MNVPDPQLLLASAGDALEDTFTIQGLRARQPRLPAGGYDWNWRGPRDDPEWAWFFNRHHWLPALHYTYQAQQSPRCLDALLATLDDWIGAHPPPGRISFSPAWRPLEAARRLLSSWLPLWPQLGADPAVPPAFLARLRASLLAHGRHLRHHHALGGNHLVTEMLALTRLALLFVNEHPEADDWLRYALRRLERSHRDQVYPDGAYKELSAHYQRIVTINYASLPGLLAEAGRTDEAAAWTRRLQPLWDYVHGVMTPAGGAPLNNDSDHEDYRALLAEYQPALAASPPDRTRHFPWAGQTLFRDGPRGEWAFFDAGPRGTDHDHADHLSLALALGDDELLVDNGRHTYRPGPARDYFAGPAGHNVVLLDTHGAAPGPRALARAPHPERFVPLPGHAALAWGDTFFSLPATPRAGDWRRVVLHAPTAGWVVIDRLILFTPRKVETLWHWHPQAGVELDATTGGLAVRGPASTLNLSAPAGGDWSLIRGQTEPTFQGWHSRRFNQREPSVCAQFTQRLDRPTLNVWTFAPAGGTPFAITRDGETRLRVTVAGAALCTLDLRGDGSPLA